MKQKDVIILIVVAGVSLLVSVPLSRYIIPANANKLKAQTVSPISTDFEKPDTKYFNEQAIDPTVIIRVGDESNDDPFH